MKGINLDKTPLETKNKRGKINTTKEKPIVDKRGTKFRVEKTLLVIFIFIIALLLWKSGYLSKNTFVTIFTGKRIQPTPQEQKGFRVVERIPAEDGPSYKYEIRYKFSEPVSPEDFEVTAVNKLDPTEVVDIKKVVVPAQPNVLWIVPKKPWKYLTEYIITVIPTNPDKQIKETLKMRYEYLKWEGPVGFIDTEDPNQKQTTPSKSN